MPEEEYDRVSAAIPAPSQQVHPKTRKLLLEERLIALIFQEPSNLQLCTQEYLPCVSIPTQELLAGFQRNPTLEFEGFEGVFPSETIERLKSTAFESEIEEEGESPEEEFLSCLKELKSLYHRGQLDQLVQDIKQAEADHDPRRVDALMQEFHEISRSFHLL